MRIFYQLSKSFSYITVPYSTIFAVLSILFSLLYSDINNNIQILIQSERLGRNSAVIFNTFYTSNNIADVKDENIDFIANLDRQHKYISAILHNIPYDLQHINPHKNVTILIGNKLDEVYPELKLCNPPACGMKGFDLKNIPITSYSIEDLTINFDHTLPRDAVWFDTNSIGIDLNDHIIIRLAAEHIAKVAPESREEAITKSILFTNNDSVLQDFIIQSRSSKLVLTPIYLGSSMPTRLSELIATALIFLLALLSTIVLATGSFIYSFRDLVRIINFDFNLRFAYGANPLWLLAYYSLHIVLTIFLLPAILNILIITTIYPLESGAFIATIYIVTVLAISLIMLYYSIWREVYSRDHA